MYCIVCITTLDVIREKKQKTNSREFSRLANKDDRNGEFVARF